MVKVRISSEEHQEGTNSYIMSPKPKTKNSRSSRSLNSLVTTSRVLFGDASEMAAGEVSTTVTTAGELPTVAVVGGTLSTVAVTVAAALMPRLVQYAS